MGTENTLQISQLTLKLVKRYMPEMGIALPLDENAFYRIYKNFYGQEVSYTMWADQIKEQKGDWISLEDISNMFARAADELSAYDETGDPDFSLLSDMIEKTIIVPDDEFPEYRQWYTKDGKATDW